MGWSDHNFGGFQPPKDFVGSLQPNKSNQGFVRGEFCSGEPRDSGGRSEEGKNCSLHFAVCHFLHPKMQVAVRKGAG